MAVICLYTILAVAFIPIAKVAGPEIPGFVTVFTAGIFITELSTSFLLFVVFRESRTWSPLLLGCAYFYSALMSVSQLLTFPGAILANKPLITVSQQSTAWIFAAWINGFALVTLIAVLMEARFSELRIRQKNVRCAAITAFCAVLVGVLIIALAVEFTSDQLPVLVDEFGFTPRSWMSRWLTIALLYTSIALILFGMREPSHLYLWLSWALTAMLFHNLLSAIGGARFTIGWSVGRLSWLLSASALFIYFLSQFARQQHVLTQKRDTVEQLSEKRMVDAPINAPEVWANGLKH